MFTVEEIAADGQIGKMGAQTLHYRQIKRS